MAGMKNEHRAMLALNRAEQAIRDFSWLASVPRVNKHDNQTQIYGSAVLTLIKDIRKRIETGRLEWPTKK
jgi:hypothetical protein